MNSSGSCLKRDMNAGASRVCDWKRHWTNRPLDIIGVLFSSSKAVKHVMRLNMLLFLWLLLSLAVVDVHFHQKFRS